MTRVLLATLGFDERHVVRSLLRLGFGGVAEVLLLVPAGGVEERTLKAVDEIKKLASMASVDRVEMVEIPVDDIVDGVARIYRVVREAVEKYSEAVVSLGGGLRALVVETLLAVLLLPDHIRDRITVVVDLETGKGSIEFKPSIAFMPMLTDVDMRVLALAVKKGSITLGEALNELSIPRSTIWKALEKLREEGLLERRDGNYFPTLKGRMVAKVLNLA